jgi:hypothetical protein
MAFVSKKTASIFLTQEVTEGTPVAPSVGTDAIGVLADGFELNGEKELVERNLLRSGISKQVPLVGIQSSTASISCECATSSTEGSAPEFDILMKGLLGGKHQVTVEVISNSSSDNTTSKIFMVEADAQKFMVGESVVAKATGAYHFSPIKAIVSAGIDSYIELLVPAGAVFADDVHVSKVTTYYGANTGHGSITVTSFLEGAIKMQASGCKVASMSLEGYEVGQLPTLSFSLQGANYTESVEAQTVTPAFSQATPALILGACVFMDDVAIPVSNVALSIENTLGKITSTCAPNGVIAQLTSGRAVSGSFTTYLENDNVDMFTKFNSNTQFSLFLYAKNPTAVAGQGKNYFGFFVPAAIITGQPKADTDGIVTIEVAWQAGEDANGKDIFVSFV